jgi:hypothetical protein
MASSQRLAGRRPTSTQEAEREWTCFTRPVREAVGRLHSIAAARSLARPVRYCLRVSTAARVGSEIEGRTPVLRVGTTTGPSPARPCLQVERTVGGSCVRGYYSSTRTLLS